MPFLHDVTIDGRPCVLVLPQIDWAVRPKIAHVFEADEAEANTGIEAVAPGHLAMRLELALYYVLEYAVADEFIADLLALGTKRLALPLPPDDLDVAEYTAALRIYSAAHQVNYDATTGAYALDADAGHPRKAGLVVCTLRDRPRIVARTDKHCTVQLAADEDSPYAARVAVNPIETVTAWEWEPDYVSPPEDLSKWQLKREPIGSGREAAVSGEDSPAKHGQKAKLTLESRTAIRRLLTFWADRRGAVRPFAVPLWFTPGWDNTGDTPALNARFGQTALELEFLTQDHASTTVTVWQQLLLTPGQPDQHRPGRAWLLKLWWEGASTRFAWTTWESTLSHGGIDYAPARVEVQAPTQTLKAGDNDWNFLLDDFDGNPLRVFDLLALERRMLIEIREADPENAAAAALRFVGEVSRAPSRGSVYTAECSLLGGRLRRLVPGYYDAPDCNYSVFSELCGLSAAAHQRTGAVAAVAASVVDVTTADGSTADYFAGGDAEFGTGDALERRFIVRSTPIGGGQRLTLHRPLDALGTGAAVKFWPGCDNQFLGGCAKLGNQGNFGGFPWKPAYIESVSSGFKAKAGK